jgi:hypothetical protein
MAHEGGGARDLREYFQIPWTLTLSQSAFEIPPHILPRQTILGDLVAVGGVRRCGLKEGTLLYSGGRGEIRAVERDPSVGFPLCIKKPHDRAYSLCSEAMLQWLAGQTLIQAGIHGAVPPVIDLYQFAGETRFTMKLESGISAADWLLLSPTPDLSWWQIVTQTAFLLGILEERMRFDHRDLKADNVWIVPRPVELKAELYGSAWIVSAPFQVVLLDFGFGCIGGEAGNAIVSLTDGLVPKIDPCPKEGRDLFHFLTSLWSVPQLRERMSSDVRTEMEELFKARGGTYIPLIERAGQVPWIYGALNPAGFRHPALSCRGLLDKIAQKGVCWRGPRHPA